LQTVYLKILEGKACFSRRGQLEDLAVCGDSQTAIGEHRKNILRKLRWSDSFRSYDDSGVAAGTALGAFEKSETQALFQSAMESLPRRQREALHSFLPGLSLSEAAEVMGISIGSARQHYDRGKKRLREFLGQTESAYWN